MSKQSENFETLVKGNSVAGIVNAIKKLSPSVRKELMMAHHVGTVVELARKLQ